uniref:Uncharacterized protein n=1 Tax=Aegilops tauschii subsp. strangulata TaxID=200361 RepID=A0A453KXQ5_AEGTS
GEASVLRQGGRQEGAVDAGGGPHARLLHPGARPRELARRADKHRADAVQQELPASVDQLPPAGDQARQLHRPGREAHRPPPGAPRQPVMIASVSSFLNFRLVVCLFLPWTSTTELLI